jgi:hypothetical protein
MSSSPPHLLTLPREVRDIIYHYLTQDIDLDWGYKILPFPLGGHYAVKLRLRNAPLPNVLLSCTRIYDEYSQASCFRKPSVTINVGKHHSLTLRESEPTNQKRAFEVLRRVQHCDFRVDGTDRSVPEALWTTIDQLSQAVSVLAPNLETIKVVSRPKFHERIGNDPDELEMMYISDGAFATPVKLSPLVLAGRLLLHGQQAFWNQQVNPHTLLHEREAGTGPGNVLAGEWYFVRGKGCGYTAANR